MNHPPDMLRQQPNVSHLSGNTMLNPQHLFQGQRPQPPASQQHPMNMLPNGSNQNPPMGLGNNPQPLPPNMGSNPTPAQMYQNHHIMTQRQAHSLLSASQNNPQALNANPPGGPHINGINTLNYPASGMPAPGQPLRRSVSQSQGSNPPGVNHMGGMHPGQQPGMGGMGAIGLNSQPMPHRDMRMQQQQMSRMPQQQPGLQMPMQMSSDMSMLGQRPQQVQGGPLAIPRGPPSQQPPINNISQQQQNASQPHPTGMPSSLHQMNYANPTSIPHQQPQQMGPSPHPTFHPQSQPPGNMPQSMNEGTPNRARLTPDNAMHMQHYQHQQFNQGMPGNNRMPNNNGQFGFPPSSSTPPDHDMGPGLPNSSGPPGRTNYHLTPAQQLRNGENFNASHFYMPQNQHAPPRPPSLNPQSQPMPIPPSSQPSHQSPEHMNLGGPLPQNLQRPQSQPQMPAGPARPPSQQGPSRTPHMANPPLPGMQPQNRVPPSMPGNGPGGPNMGPQQGPPQPPQMTPQQSQLQAVNLPPSGQPGHSFPPGAPRPQGQGMPVPTPGSTGPSNAEASTSQVISSQKVIIPPIGMGQGVLRLLAFSGNLAQITPDKLGLPYWENLITEFFTQKAVMKYTLWKDNQRNEAKPFEIGVPILPRFFLVTSQSGVKSMNLTLDGARERIISPGHAVVECVSAVWTYKYNNGYTIHLRGPLTAHIWVTQALQQPAVPSPSGPNLSLKFEHLQFDANYHDKYITLESINGTRIGKSPRMRNPPTPVMNGMNVQQQPQQQQQPDNKDDRIHYEWSSLPTEPVNAFGVPQATMRCLELAESVAQMTDLIQFSTENNLGPLQSLKQFAKRIKETQGPNALRNMMPTGPGPMGGPGFQKNGSYGTKPMTPSSVTLYQGTSSSPMPMMPIGPTTPQNLPPSGETSSPLKQPKATPQPPTSTASASTPPASATASTTPSLAAATLKRKAQGDTSSPTAGDPPPKRTTRNKRRAGGTG